MALTFERTESAEVNLTKLSDLDIWRSAQALIQGYGDQAQAEAKARASSLARKGDEEGPAGEKIH